MTIAIVIGAIALGTLIVCYGLGVLRQDTGRHLEPPQEREPTPVGGRLAGLLDRAMWHKDDDTPTS